MSVHTNSDEKKSSSVRISETVFSKIFATRSRRILGLARHLELRPMGKDIFTRPLVGEILSQSAQLEELLDAYGAKNNRQWAPFRELISSLRLFSAAAYKLLHIQHSQTSYHLLKVDGELGHDTQEALLFVCNVLMLISTRTIEVARELGLAIPDEIPADEDFAEELPPGHLPHDRTARHVTSAEETVTQVATAFLNLAAASSVLHIYETCPKREFSSCIPTPINEKMLRHLEEEFHNLQALYDTHVSDTDTESLDSNLKVLRGHISIIYHLLETATLFTHFYERHMIHSGHETGPIYRPLINPSSLLDILMTYSLGYSSRYLKNARQLCQKMLKRYAVIEEVNLPVPRYRGFHVRPSTLVAKIVQHYGSEVRMKLGDESYDAGAPIDLFRANEKINAEKRRRIASEISRFTPATPCGSVQELISAIQVLIHRLAEEHMIVIYERPLPLDELHPEDNETLAQFAVDEIARLLATGKIDIEADIEVTFAGDRRVLEDITLLAENGYGEDAFGNNIPLPEKLQYLRR